MILKVSVKNHSILYFTISLGSPDRNKILTQVVAIAVSREAWLGITSLRVLHKG
jgi:hypothetical protein